MLAVALFVAAGPIISNLSGYWAGKGKGSCHPPGATIYPWQNWKGAVTNDEKTFYGEWYDKLGNTGSFKGIVDFISITTAVCKGEWVWDNPSGTKPVTGTFQMTFYIHTGSCKGTWNSVYPSTTAKGTMVGKKVD